MPDITMCINNSCPIREKCFRFRAIPDKYNQSYSRFQYTNQKGKVFCDDYLPIYSHTRLNIKE